MASTDGLPGQDDDKFGEAPKRQQKSGQALLEELRQAAGALRGADEVPSEERSSLLASLACGIESAARGLEDVLRQLEARAAQRPTHFVGLRMPQAVQARLTKLQERLLQKEPSLKKAAVHIEKSHVTLLVTRVEMGMAAVAQAALSAAAEAWQNSEGKELRHVSVASTGHFAHNGVLFSPMAPVELLQALRGYLLQAFAQRGFSVMDEKDVADTEAAKPGQQELDAGAESVDEDGSDAGGEREQDSSADEDVKERDNKASAAVARDRQSKRQGTGSGGSKSGEFLPHVTLFKSSQAGRGKSGKKAAQAAKKAVLKVAKALDQEAARCIDFGSFPIEMWELVDMRNTQADGYYEVQATAALAPEPRAKKEAGCDPNHLDEEDEMAFDNTVTRLLSPLQQQGNQSDRTSSKTVNTKKKKQAKTLLAERQDETGNVGEEEKEEEEVPSTVKAKKTAKAKAKVSAKAKERVQNKAIEPETWGSDGESEELEEDEGDVELRTDPEDGTAYTWEEFSAYYTGKYKKKVIEAYWEDCLRYPEVRHAEKTKRKKVRKSVRRWTSGKT